MHKTLTKKVNYLLPFLLLVITFTQVNGQQAFYKSYDWGKPPKVPVNEAQEKIIIKKKEVVEFTHEKDDFIQYYTKDQIEYINSDDEVENSNKRYIYFSKSSEVVSAKARVINPDNNVILLDDSKILESTNEETGEHYKYFAFEGLQKGSVIEYLYTIKGKSRYTGVRKIIQGDLPINEYEFDLISDPHLVFKFKVYNDTNTVILDTLVENKNHWKLHLDSIPGLEEEAMAPYSLLLKQFVYKLDVNTATSAKDISSYGIASRNIYSNINSAEKVDVRAIKKIIKKIGISKNDGLEDKIRKVENYLKDNISITEASDNVFSVPAAIYINKIADSYGITKMFALIFNQLEINYQMVITCSRDYSKFDPDFEAFNYLSYYLMYFPKTKKFLAPYELNFRYGLIPYEYTDNYGLFIKELSLGDYKTGIGKIKFIPPSDCTQSYSNLDVKVFINENMDEVSLDISDTYKGYYAAYIQPYFNMINEEQKEKLAKDQIYALIKTIDIKDWEIINTKPEDIGVKDFIIKCQGRYDELIENAGKKYILKVGELIGPQFELYNKRERELPVYSDFLRTYNRILEINIPDGYRVKNLDDLIIYADYVKDGDKVLMFDSKYKIEGDKIIVTIKEYYNQLYFTLDEYPEYQKVVNSASDFNKLALILEKK